MRMRIMQEGVRTINLETLNIEIRAEDKNVNKAINNVSEKFKGLDETVSTTTEHISSKFESVGKSGANLGKAIEFGLKGAVIGTVAKAGLECIKMASELEEVQNVVDVTFGSMSDRIDEFAQNAIKNFGMSEKAAKQYAGTMGSILSSLGATREEAALMSTNLTNLAGDYASFYNISQDNAFEKIRSAVGSGETEAIKSLGVNMSVASLEAYRLSQGISVSYSNMDSFNQAILRYNYLMSVSSNQMGDFARTSETYANSTRTLSQEWDILRTTVGQALTGVVQPFIAGLNTILEGLAKVKSAIANVFGGAKASGSVGTSLLPNATESSENLEKIKNDITPVKIRLADTAKSANNTAKGLKKAGQAAKGLKTALMGFDEINSLNLSDAAGAGTTGTLKNLKDAADAAGSISQNINDAYGYQEKLNGSAEKTNSFFGDAKLSSEQIKSIVGQIVDEGKLKKMGELTQEVNKLDNLAKNLEDAKATLDGYNWMIEAGFKVDEKGYKKAVDDYLKACNDYIVQSKKVVVLSAEILFGEGSEEAKEMSSFYDKIQNDLATLSTKIKNKVNEAWADGVITIDEKKEIDSLMEQYNKIIKAVSTGEAKAKISRLEVQFDNKALDENSFKSLMSELDAALQKQLDGYDEAYLNYTAGVYAEYELSKKTDADKKKLEQKLQEAKDQLQKDINNTKLEACAAKINIIANMNLSDLDNLKKDAEKYFETARKTVNEAMKDGIVTADELQDLQANINDIASVFKTATPEIKAQAQTLVEALEPNAKEWEKIAKQYTDKGEEVPKSISSGLSSYYYAKALTGDIDAIFKLVGGQCEVSPEASKAFEKAYGFSSSVIDSLVEGNKLGMPSVKASVSDVLKAASTAMTGDNKTNADSKAKTAGTSLTNSYKDGINSGKTNAGNTASNIVSFVAGKFGKKLTPQGKTAIDTFSNGLKDGTILKKIESNANAAAKKAQTGAGKISLKTQGQTAVKSYSNALAEKSPLQKLFSNGQYLAARTLSGVADGLKNKNGKSQKFAEYGKNTVEGYNKGIEDNKGSTTKEGGVISSWVGGIGSFFKKLMGIHSPSRLFKSFGGYTVEGFNNGIVDNLDTTESVLEDWADVMNGFCDNIDLGEIQTPRTNLNVATADFTELTQAQQQNMRSYDRPVNISLKVNDTTFAKVTADSLNRLIAKEGEMVLDMSYA